MERVMGKRFVRATLRGTRRRDDSIGFGLGALILAALAVADALIALDVLLVGSFVAAPFVCALFARPSITSVIGILAIAAAAASRQWHPDLGDGYWIALAIVGGGTAFAVASARNRDRFLIRGERLRILDAVATIADGSRPLDETLDTVTRQIVPAVADICIIDAIHPGGVMTAAVRSADHPRRAEIEDRLRRRPPSLPKWLVTGERQWRHIPRWRPRMRTEELRRMARSEDDFEFLASLRIRSALVVPISSRDNNLGALTLFSAWSGRRYSEDDVRFAQIAARRIGLALENAGLFSDLESVERRMNTVMSILDEVVTIHSRGGEMVFANAAAARALGFDSPDELVSVPPDQIDGHLVVRDESGRPLGPGSLLGGAHGPGTIGEVTILRVTDTGTRRETWYRRRAQSIEGPDRAPLYVVTVLEDVTDVKRAEFAQSLLARTGELLGSSTDYAATLDEVARIAVPELADWCTVNVPKPGGKIEPLAAAHADRSREGPARELRERYPMRIDEDQRLAEVIRTGRAALFEVDEQRLREFARDEEHLALLERLELRSVIIAPMTAGRSVVGAIALVNGVGSRSFDDGDLEIAIEIGRRAGLAVENARIAGERARVAEALQRELLPPDLPEMEGWEVATMYRPAGEVSEVGGDFYEAFAIRDGWIVVLGDISGHGAFAASLTAVARHTIRAATTVAADPTVGLRTLDARLRERDAVALCSVAVVMLAPVNGGDGGEDVEVRIWRAGHPPPFLLRGSELRELGAPGPLVGIGECPEWTAEAVSMAPGDQLVIYTDGVVEARYPDGDRFGVERLRRRLISCEAPSTAVSRVESALAELPGEASDDATLVAIRRSPGPASSPADSGDGASPASQALEREPR